MNKTLKRIGLALSALTLLLAVATGCESHSPSVHALMVRDGLGSAHKNDIIQRVERRGDNDHFILKHPNGELHGGWINIHNHAIRWVH